MSSGTHGEGGGAFTSESNRKKSKDWSGSVEKWGLVYAVNLPQWLAGEKKKTSK